MGTSHVFRHFWFAIKLTTWLLFSLHRPHFALWSFLRNAPICTTTIMLTPHFPIPTGFSFLLWQQFEIRLAWFLVATWISFETCFIIDIWPSSHNSHLSHGSSQRIIFRKNKSLLPKYQALQPAVRGLTRKTQHMFGVSNWWRNCYIKNFRQPQRREELPISWKSGLRNATILLQVKAWLDIQYI